jgi:hypothetical protein
VKVEAIMSSRDHRLGGCDLGLAYGTGGLHLDNDGMIEIDQVVGRVGEEREAAVCRGPPRGRIDRCEILRCDGRRRTKGRIIQYRQILLNRATRSSWTQSFRALHPALAVSISLDQTGIDSEALTADQPFTHAAADDGLEHIPQRIAVTEAAMAVLGEG